eukprot:5604378-Pyramimonas_sp.AAC.2
MTGMIDTLRWNATSRMPPSMPIRTLMRARLHVLSCVDARRSHRIVGPNMTYQEQLCCSERLTTATRHKPFHYNQLSRFLRAVPSIDESDGWVELSELPNLLPPEAWDRCRPKNLETVRRYLSNRHWAFN